MKKEARARKKGPEWISGSRSYLAPTVQMVLAMRGSLLYASGSLILSGSSVSGCQFMLTMVNRSIEGIMTLVAILAGDEAAEITMSCAKGRPSR
jgi:hypothetical protein